MALVRQMQYSDRMWLQKPSQPTTCTQPAHLGEEKAEKSMSCSCIQFDPIHVMRGSREGWPRSSPEGVNKFLKYKSPSVSGLRVLTGRYEVPTTPFLVVIRKLTKSTEFPFPSDRFCARSIVTPPPSAPGLAELKKRCKIA